MDENKILYADNLVIGNDGRALTKKMSFRIVVGECILLCGANGIGKSTLLRTLAGIIPAVSGEIGMRGRSSRVILVPARIPKVPGFSVTDFVATSCYRESDWLGRLPAKIRSQILETLETLGIGNLAGRDISSLSDGEFQKAAIATALLQQAEVVLLDEPTAFLDADSRESALCTLREVALRKHVSIIFSSHDIHTAAKYCTRVFGMQVGDDSDMGNGRSLAELRYGRQMDETRQHRWNGSSLAELNPSAEHRCLAEMIDTGPGCTREQRDAVFSRCFRYWGEDSEN